MKTGIIICKDNAEAEKVYALAIRIGYNAQICCAGGYYNAVEFWQ